MMTVVLMPAAALCIQNSDQLDSGSLNQEGFSGQSSLMKKNNQVSSADKISKAVEPVVFKVKPGPPPGFELLAKNPHQDTYISIFYNGNLVTNILADFDDSGLRLKNPVLVVDKIPHLNKTDLKKRAALIAALSGKIEANQDLLCPYNHGDHCHTLSPKVAGVIFDSQNYRADLFINPEYLDIIRQDHEPLPNSSAGFSFLSRNMFQGTKVQNFKGATWGNTTILGQGNNELTTSFGYTESWNQSTSSGEDNGETHQFSLNTVTAGRYDSGILYQAGMVNENTGDFFTPPTLGGVNIQNYGAFTNLSSEIKGTPLVVYLPMAGTVVVQRQGQILAAVSLPAGRQELDTTNFPIGAYNVDITITSQSGQVSNQTQFYVKQETLPEYGHHNFDVALGLLQKTRYSSSSNQVLTSPSFFNVPIFSYYDMRKLFGNVGLGSTLMTSSSRAYLSEVFHVYEDNLDFSPGGVVSSEGDSGLKFGTEYSNNFMSMNFQGLKLFPRQTYLTEASSNGTTPLSLINQSADTFYPLPTNLSEVSANMSFFGAGNQVSVGGSWFKDFLGSVNKTENISFSRMLIGGETGNLILGLSLTHQDQIVQLNSAGQTNQPQSDTIGLVTLTYNFFTVEFNGNAVLRLSNQNQNTDGSRPYVPGLGLSGTHTSQTDANHSWSATGTVDADSHRQSLGVDLNGTSPMAYGDFSVTNNQFSSGYGQNNTQYAASLVSTVAYAGGHVAMGNNQSYSTGIVVEVDSPVPAEFSLYDNENYLGSFSTNHSHSVFVQPYSVHRLTIQPNTQDIYHFDQDPKEIVLYQGNVQYLHWALEKQYLLFAKVVHLDKEGKLVPLSNYLLENKGEYDTTDEQGYVQAGLTPSMQKLIFEGISGDRCQVILPKDMAQQVQGGVVAIPNPLKCESI